MFLAIANAFAIAALANPGHTTEIEHRGTTYDVEYQAIVDYDTRVVGTAPPTRPGSRRCEMTVRVSVERHIRTETGSHAIKHLLPGAKTYRTSQPGRCTNTDEKLARLTRDKHDDIRAHVAALAGTDRQAAIAAIEAAHNLAAR